ncbi:MAG: RagB/SusD family nutrient uptake outer membrane protein [Mediterranea sp.]|jgi:hypothetical protein|nr:RagB/SusD family nutrient uptake outer membrane protein [Mediterranea sp.]
MRPIKHILSVAAVAFVALATATSCSESFLDLKAPSQVSIDEYYDSEERMFESLVAAYDPLKWFDWGMGEYNPINIMSDIMADDIWVGGTGKSDNANWHYMMNYEARPTAVIAGIWISGYSGVKRCNDVFYYMSRLADIDETTKTLWLTEARVLRAWYYTLLWKFWGNIPYYTENLQFPYLQPQSTADQVYEGIVADLDEAIAANALPMKAADADAGRVTKAMAYMLYAEVVMYQKDETRYPTALKYMEEIINSSQYILAPDYGGIFLEEGEWNSESIWEVNYMNDRGGRSWSGPLVTGGTVLPRLISPSGWADGTDGHDNGWGFAPVRVETYQMYADADTRRDATCWNAAAAGSYGARYQDTGYFLGKYVARSGYNANHNGDGDLNFGNNLRVYRFAETLLNAAELLARGAAGTGSAADYLNRVHHRAGLTDDLAPTVDNILQERRLEFVGEGKRYWDLIRTDRAASTLVPDAYGYRTNAWTPAKKYLPIPQSEIDAAQGTLTQNNY